MAIREGTQWRLDRFFMAAEKIALERLTSARCKSRPRAVGPRSRLLAFVTGRTGDNAAAVQERKTVRESETHEVIGRSLRDRGTGRLDPARELILPEAVDAENPLGNEKRDLIYTRRADTFAQLIKCDL